MSVVSDGNASVDFGASLNFCSPLPGVRLSNTNILHQFSPSEKARKRCIWRRGIIKCDSACILLFSEFAEEENVIPEKRSTSYSIGSSGAILLYIIFFMEGKQCLVEDFCERRVEGELASKNFHRKLSAHNG